MGRLHSAARSGKEDQVAEALAMGADIDAPSIRGFTPLMIAAQEGHVGVTRQLLAAGADIHLRHRNRNMALHFAASGGHPGVVQELVAQGADVNALAGKSTPILDAARFNYRELALFLKQHGADSTLKDDQNFSADEWLEMGGIQSRLSKMRLARTPKIIAQEEDKIRGMMAEGLSADEYMARNGRRFIAWSYGFHKDYPDPAVNAWAQRGFEILHTSGLLGEVEERFLSGETLEEARKIRARRVKSLERFRRKQARKQT